MHRLKEKNNKEKNESRSCIVAARRISDHSDEVVASLAEARAQLANTMKRKEANEKQMKTEIARLKLENEKLKSRLGAGKLKATYIAV